MGMHLRINQVLLFYVYGKVALRAIADHYEKQHQPREHVPGVNSVQEFSILH